MRCWNCRAEVPEGAKACPRCEAMRADPSSEAGADSALEAAQGLPPSVQEYLHDAYHRSGTAEEFVNMIMVGNCPKCGSAHTGDCEEDPELEDPLVARCYDCGHYWCTECGRELDSRRPYCPCMDEEKD